MPSTEYTITGHHWRFGDVTKIRYTKREADEVAAALKRIGYTVLVTDRSLVS